MMDIVVFDDNIQFLEYMKNALNELNTKYGGAFGTPTYISETNKILDYAEANKDNPTVFILDIITNGMHTGFELAKRIKEINPDDIIIYVTDFKEKILSNMVHKMLSLGFILKDSERFHAELEEGLLKAKDSFTSLFFIAKNNKSVVKVKLNDIYYFQKKKKTGYTYIVTKDNHEIVWDNLLNIIKSLNDDFCYSTKEFIVNKQAIRRIDKVKKIIYFDNGHECPYSRTRKRELFKCL